MSMPELRRLKQDLKFGLMDRFPEKGWRFFNDPDFLSDHNPDYEPVTYDPLFGEICTLIVGPEKEFRIYLRCPSRHRPECLRLAMEIDKLLLESAGVLLVEDEDHVFANLDVHGKHLKMQVQTRNHASDSNGRMECIIQQEQMLELGSEIHEIVDLLVGMVYAIVDKNNAVESNTLAGQQLHRLRREQNAFTTTALDPFHSNLQLLRNRHSARHLAVTYMSTSK